MLKRKIYKRIENFYLNNQNKALMITGARQVGKTSVIEEFGRNNFEHFIKIDFIENQDYISIFNNIKSDDDILLRLSFLFGDKMVPNKTLIFFDDIQECPEIITKIKYLTKINEYKFILSGSLLGTIFKEIRSIPVGFLEIYNMFPLDLEEFAWSNGINENVIENIKNDFINKTPIDKYIHERMMKLFELYLIVGGMPEVVNKFIKTKNLKLVGGIQDSIINLYKKDISKYDKDDKLYLDETYSLIPSELNSKNKRFLLKKLDEKAKFNKYKNSFIWLKEAGVALPTFLVDEPKSPLLLSKSSNLFKLFSNDVGLLASQYASNIQLKILNHEVEINFGSIYENFVAQELNTHGFPLYYYNNKKLGEVDFIIENEEHILPIEVKSGKNYYRHKAINNLLNCEKYNIDQGYIFTNENIIVDEKVTYFPIYMIMFLENNKEPVDLIYNIDFDSLNDYINK